MVSTAGRFDLLIEVQCETRSASSSCSTTRSRRSPACATPRPSCTSSSTSRRTRGRRETDRPALSARDGRLRVEGCDAHALAERHGTPLHVVSEDQLRRNAAPDRRRVRRGVAARAGARCCRRSRRTRRSRCGACCDEEGAGCDAFGPWELEAALRAGTPPERISFNGPAKDDAVLARAVDARRARDRRLARRARAARRDRPRRPVVRAAVRLRLRPHVPELTMPSDLLEAPVADRRRRAGVQAGHPRRPGRRGGRADRARRGPRRPRRAHALPAPRRRSRARWPWRCARTPR